MLMLCHRPIRQVHVSKRFDESQHSVLSFRSKTLQQPRRPLSQVPVRPKDPKSRVLIHSDDDDWWSDIQGDDEIDEENLIGTLRTQPQGPYPVAKEEDNDSLLEYSSDEDDENWTEQQVLHDEQVQDGSILGNYSEFGEGFHQMIMEDEDNGDEGQRLQALLAAHEARQNEENGGSQESAMTGSQIERAVDHNNVRR